MTLSRKKLKCDVKGHTGSIFFQKCDLVSDVIVVFVSL